MDFIIAFLQGLLIGAGATLAITVISVVAGAIQAIALRVKIGTINKINKHDGGKAYIIASGSPAAVAGAQEVIIGVLNSYEAEAAAQAARTQAANTGGIGLNDPQTPPPDKTIPEADSKPGGQK